MTSSPPPAPIGHAIAVDLLVILIPISFYLAFTIGRRSVYAPKDRIAKVPINWIMIEGYISGVILARLFL